MAGFSISLKSHKSGKTDKKKKRANVFNETDLDVSKKTKIRVTHIDEYKEPKKQERVIKLASISKPSNNSDFIPPVDDNELKFGLNTRESLHSNKSNVRLLGKDPTIIEQQPEVTEQEDYEDVPIEEFGNALLRGMGWDGKNDNQKNPAPSKSAGVANPATKPRPSLLGLGAKSSQSTLKDDRVALPTFLPVTKIDRKTGKRL
ncbi:LAME_0H18888g1_1 [Lachancea meyersii CBS 8951]|uniref:Pre-mRNA-splicing factor n=1 Tax=Lachancea meyersii CBS 8951 TaxID=1266667 RepID=A0A1G4KJE7_9SACH|nr:LAME_0H18888g1_1 [Lachancea meyersii CBS 8951]